MESWLISDNFGTISQDKYAALIKIVLESVQECQQAAIMAEFSAECGLEMLSGCLEDAAQHWNEEQFNRWFERMEIKYGERSPLGISMTSLYRSVVRLTKTCDYRIYLELD